MLDNTFFIKNVYDNLSNQQSQSSSIETAYISIFYLFSYHIANLHYSTMFFQFLLFNKLFKIEFILTFKLNILFTKLNIYNNYNSRRYQTSKNMMNSVTAGLAT